MDEGAYELAGGNVSTSVVRVGETVRRPAGPWTPSVHALLCHLNAVGFPGSPRSFGIDTQGRHVVEWIDGEVTHPYLRRHRSDVSLPDVGHMIRDFHEAVSGFSPAADAQWNVVIEPDAHDMIIHHDLASWNFVHGADRPVFIDWDNAGPGSALWDLALAAHGFADLAPGVPVRVAGRRLRSLVDGYGLDDAERLRLAALLPVRYRAMFDLLERGGRTGAQPWRRLWEQGHGKSWRLITQYAADHQAELIAALRA